MRISAAARRYARALFSLAQEAQRVPEVRRELEQLAELLAASSELGRALFSPLHPLAERRALLRALALRLGTSDLLRNFYSFLVDQRRLVAFPAIRQEFARLADTAAGRARASVVTAAPLRDEQRERLRRALALRTGQEIELEVRVDPELIGGAIATVGGLLFDGSLRQQLAQLRTTLTRGQRDHGGHQAR
jgi:F-type H+-transporting ATPase subunit delta